MPMHQEIEEPLADPGSGVAAVAADLLVLTLLLVPAGFAIELFGWTGLGLAVVAAWLWPVAQLLHARAWARRFRRFAAERLHGPGSRAGGGRRLYSRALADAAWSRFLARVVGTARVRRRGEETALLGAAVPRAFGDAGRPIGTAETLFLTPLVYLHVLVLEFARRTDPTLGPAALSGADPTPGTPHARLLDALDRYLRRVGEWFRGHLVIREGRFRAEIFAEATLYLSDGVERLRRVLAGPAGRGEEALDAREKAEFESELRRLGVTGPDPITAEGLDRAVERFARKHRVRAVNPFLVDMASFAPRLVFVLILTAFAWSSDSLSPPQLVGSAFRVGGPSAVLGAVGLGIGAIALVRSARRYSPDRFLTRGGGAAGEPRERAALVGLLICGAVGALLLAPGLVQGLPDLSGLILPLTAAGAFALEAVVLCEDGHSFAGIVRAYHFRPAAGVGSPRLVAFHFLQYGLFLAMGTWMGVTVAAFLEGHMIAGGPGSALRQAFSGWVMAISLAAFLLAYAGAVRSWMGSTRSRIAGLAAIVVGPLLLAYRPVGGFAIGVMILVIALYLGNLALFNLAIGLAAVAKPLGRPRHLAALALGALLAGLVIPRGAQPPPATDALASGWVALLDLVTVALLVLLMMGASEPCLAAPLLLLAVGAAFVLEEDGTGRRQLALVGLFAIGAATRLACRGWSWWEGRRRGVAAPPAPGSLAIFWTAGNPIASPVRAADLATDGQGQPRGNAAVERLLALWDDAIVRDGFRSASDLLDADGRPLSRDGIESALRATFRRERLQGRSLFGREAIAIRRAPLSPTQRRLKAARDESGRSLGLLFEVDDEEEAELLRLGLLVQRYLVTRLPVGVGASGATSQRDTMWFLVDLAYALKEAGLGDAAVLYIQSNGFGADDAADPKVLDGDSPLALELDERLALREYLRIVAGLRSEVVHVHSFDACKAAAQNGVDGAFRRVRAALILDRNAQSFALREVVADLRRMLAEPDRAVILPPRTTPNVASPIGSLSDLGEYGFTAFADAMICELGGDRGEVVATGWGNLTAVTIHALVDLFADPRVPCRFDPEAQGEDRAFGAFHGLMNAPHVSEDYVQAIGAAEGLKSLGHAPTIGLGRALYYKLREHSTVLELLAARPRWAGGGDPGQKGRDPLLQRLREFGTDSVFMREMQKDRGRYYVLAPLAMIYILMTPVLVMTGYSPFIGVSVLFVIGLGSNQVLTLNSLAVWLRRAGLAGGSATWLAQRFRDAMLFPPLAFIELCGVLEAAWKGSSYAYVFRASGGAPPPGAGLAQVAICNESHYRLMRWMVLTGVGGTVVNVLAILHLDLMNLLMLFPMLIFTLGLCLGPFVYARVPGPGPSPLDFRRWMPKLVGVALGVVAVGSLALGAGAGRLVAGPAWMGAIHLPPHVLLSALGASIIFAILPLRGALVAVPAPRADPRRSLAKWHNGGVLAGWVAMIAGGFALRWDGLGWNVASLAAGLAASGVGIAKLGRVLALARRGGWARVTAPCRVAYGRETIARTAILTTSVLIWFALVPVPAYVSFQVLHYEMIVAPRELRLILAVAAAAGALIAALGVASLAASRVLLGRRHRRLHAEYRARRGSGRPPGPAMEAAIEAALEGFRVARDTRSPTLASESLDDVERALALAESPGAFFEDNEAGWGLRAIFRGLLGRRSPVTSAGAR